MSDDYLAVSLICAAHTGHIQLVLIAAAQVVNAPAKNPSALTLTYIQGAPKCSQLLRSGAACIPIHNARENRRYATWYLHSAFRHTTFQSDFLDFHFSCFPPLPTETFFSTRNLKNCPLYMY